MSITLVTGVPGSGKSFYCMDWLEKMLKTDDEFLVLTNVEGLNVQDSRVVVCDWKRETKWFQNSHQEPGIKKLRAEHQLSQDAKIYYIIDEAQRFFPPELKDNDTVFFFDYHRHYGLDIFLITQHAWKLSKKIATLVELEYRAVNNKINPLPVFVYKVLAGGEQFRTDKLKKRKEVFALYCSFQAGDKGTSDKTMLFWVGVALVVFVGGWFWWRASFADSLGARTHKMQGLEDRAASARSRLSDSSRPVRSVPPTYETEPVPTSLFDASSSPVVAPEDQPKYQAPVLLRYVRNTDSVVYQGENGFEVSCPFDDFVDRFPPMLYGYGYMHASNTKLILMDAGTHDIIFPVHYSLPRVAGRTPAAKSSVPVDTPVDSSARQGFYDYDDSGLTLQDKLTRFASEQKMAELARLQARPMNP